VEEVTLSNRGKVWSYTVNIEGSKNIFNATAKAGVKQAL